MFSSPDQVSKAQQQAYEAMVNFTNSAIGYAEKMANLHLSYAKETNEANVAQGKKLMDVKDMQELMQTQSASLQPQFERIINYSKSLLELSSQAQEEMTKTIEANVAEISNALFDALDKAAKNGPAGSDAAVVAAKSVLAATNSAYDSMNKAAKKVAEITASNINAATQATTSGSKKSK